MMKNNDVLSLWKPLLRTGLFLLATSACSGAPEEKEKPHPTPPPTSSAPHDPTALPPGPPTGGTAPPPQDMQQHLTVSPTGQPRLQPPSPGAPDPLGPPAQQPPPPPGPPPATAPTAAPAGQQQQQPPATAPGHQPGEASAPPPPPPGAPGAPAQQPPPPPGPAPASAFAQQFGDTNAPPPVAPGHESGEPNATGPHDEGGDSAPSDAPQHRHQYTPHAVLVSYHAQQQAPGKAGQQNPPPVAEAAPAPGFATFSGDRPEVQQPPGEVVPLEEVRRSLFAAIRQGFPLKSFRKKTPPHND